jgi:phenylacetate-CoA ligase
MRDALIRGLLRPLYEAQRWVRPAMRPAILARNEGLRFRRRAWCWPEDRRRDWVLERLREVVREAARTPFYARRFRDVGFDPATDFSFDDFAGLPPLERKDVRDHLDDMRMPGLDPRLVRRDSTGGSSGEPTVVFKGPQERGWGESAQIFFMARIGVPPGSRTALLWGHHLDPVASDRWGDRFHTFVENARWYDCLRLSEQTLAAYHRDLQIWRPQCLVAYASALAPLAQVAERQGGPPGYPATCFVTGAEKLHGHHRELVERVYGRPVYERYGARDVGMLGFQANVPESRHFEVDWASALVEPLEEGLVTPIMVTKLRADAMPMIRYRLGDLGRFPPDARPGYPAFRLDGILGRDTDRLWLPDGSWFHPLAVPHLMKDFPVRDFRLVQSGDYSVALEVVKAPGFTGQDEVEILKVIRGNLPGLPVTFRECESIPRTPAGKLRPVVSHAVGPEGAQSS